MNIKNNVPKQRKLGEHFARYFVKFLFKIRYYVILYPITSIPKFTHSHNNHLKSQSHVENTNLWTFVKLCTVYLLWLASNDKSSTPHEISWHPFHEHETNLHSPSLLLSWALTETV